MPETIRPLGEVLTTIEDSLWNHALFLDPQRPWTEQTRCAVLDQDDIEDPYSDDVPDFALRNGLVYALLVSETLGIVENAKLQKLSVTRSEFVQAFNYYYDHDAFVEL